MDEEGITFRRARKHGAMTYLVLGLNYVTQVLLETADLAGQITEAAAQHREHLLDEEKFEEVIGGFDGDAS